MLLYDKCEHDVWRDPYDGEKIMDDFLNWLIQMDERS